jgi:hypothetical protein
MALPLFFADGRRPFVRRGTVRGMAVRSYRSPRSRRSHTTTKVRTI